MKSPLIASLALFAALSSSLLAQSTTIGRSLMTPDQPNSVQIGTLNSDTSTYAIGDSFNFGAFTGQLTLTNLRLWVTDTTTPATSYTLMAGYDDASLPGTIWTQNDIATAGPGTLLSPGLTQLDFDLNFWAIDASHTIYFGLRANNEGVDYNPRVRMSSNMAFGGDGNVFNLGAFINDTSFYYNTHTSPAQDINFEVTFTGGNSGNPDVAPVPEPATYGLIGAGALALVGFARRRRQARA